MFETAEIGRKLDKSEYEQQVAELRTKLLAAQHAVRSAELPVVILLGGVDGAGRGDFLHLLYQWLDPRTMLTHAYEAPTEEERQRPEFWRFWMWLPPRGHTAVFVGSWYTRPILDRVYGACSEEELSRQLQRILDFEEALVEDGVLIIKLWFHISKKEQRHRFKQCEKSKSTSWRVTERDWKHHKLYDDFVTVCTRALRTTSSGSSPWTVIECTDPRYRDVEAGRQIVARINEALVRKELREQPQPEAATPDVADTHTIFDTLDLGQSLKKSEYDKRLVRAQARVNRCARKLSKRQKSAIFVFEGSDAAGKGGAIRRIIYTLDPRWYRVIRIAAPTDEERARHYLWRFWRHLPRRGRITIYDRSWYGRVLVERVEGFAKPREWRRAYKEINDFEEQLVEAGTVLLKFWLHISSEEQLERFQERENSPYKNYKITPEDYRNRAKTHEYEAAASEMIARTSTEYAPWHLIEAEDKRFARVKIIETACKVLKAAL